MEQLTQHDPRRIGPFEVLGRLGAGGMGLVYLARSASGRRVAIKTVRTELAEDQLFRVRFTREVEAARAVSGFYTAAVVDADPRAAVPWLATAYVPAPSLEEIVNECGPLPAQAVRWLAAGIAEALQSIHGGGLVHRDLKPSNVLVVEDGPRVIDFGIASGVSNTRLTMTNVAVGTPAYMSPEQARDSRSVTGASDVFSLGSTLVFAGTGHAPFHGANPVETVFMLLREGPDLAGLPDELLPLIESCMQMTAGERPSPADLQAQLAPHLFASGGDDSGTASAWLPDSAVALIEERRGGRGALVRPAGGQRQGRSGGGGSRGRSDRSPAGQPGGGSGWGPAAGGDPRGGLSSAGPAPASGRHTAHAAPAAPSSAAMGPPAAAPASAPPAQVTSAPATSGPGASAPVSAQPPLSSPPSSSASYAPPAPHGAPPTPQGGPSAPHGPRQTGAGSGGPRASDGPDGSVRLAGSQVPIGPGPRAADARDGRAAIDGGPATGWVRPPSGGPGVGHGGSPGGHPPGPGPAAHGLGPGPAPGHRSPDEAGRAGGHGGPGGPINGGDGGRGAYPAHPQGDGEPAADPVSGGQGRWRPWRFRMSNDVWGTPAVAGDLLYVTSFEVHALDTGTGRRVFKTRDVAWAMAVSGGRIHASDGTTLYALDAADGAERWRLATDGWVYSLSVDRGTVVTGTRGGGVQAWEAANGELLWEKTGAQTDFETPESGPAIHGDTVYVWSDARLRALEARTGVERWSYPVGDAASCGGVPVRLLHAPDGVAYVTAGTRVLAIDIARGDVRWRFEAPAVFLSPPAYAPGAAVAGGGIYIADYLGTVYALDATNGRDRWRIATEPRQSIEPVLVAAGSVHLGSGGALYTLDAVTGTPKWRFAAGGEVIGAPVVADGRVHFGSADHCLYTVDATGGQLRWKLATGGEITGSPVAVAGVVYACSKDRCVYALDAVKGTGLSRSPARQP
ncbi:outer membrane protein assembly factor BamB family protein [Streptomyces zagrosensis]|uniref:Serine/threonine-protein kinase AfsK n=1 Tax=Streptomyces zagrosensis TaxID=1042984 RepID=A0A7W9V267_9ACTN|nr:PQQ-binding-like beta-propeller repeat protein [Streptomyces zagrosensis]MBB5939647.1 outer membrane protein assembly factor BamB/tRNA A-37 threonylcarbamoyl transferase component Bud32 [Streptomyces zagrosensis]